jgi:hypothetical protein
VLAKNAAVEALSALADECTIDTAFRPQGMELDEYTCLRNTVTLGAWSTLCLVQEDIPSVQRCIELIERFEADGRLWFWGESAFSTLLAIVWLLERKKRSSLARALLLGFAEQLATHQQLDSVASVSGPYIGGDEVLKKWMEVNPSAPKKRRNPVQSYSLLPLTFLMIRRNMRKELEDLWPQLSRVPMTHFAPDKSWGYLEWHCDEGVERDQFFEQPQSWKQLAEMASSPKVERLPAVLRNDKQFGLMFFLAVPHRIAWSIIGGIDQFFSPRS